MIWSKEETLPREEIEKIQLERLKETVARVYAKVPAYAKKMDDAGVKVEDIQKLSDLSKLPFVTKQDMRDNYPFGLFAVEKDKLVRIAGINAARNSKIVPIGNIVRKIFVRKDRTRSVPRTFVQANIQQIFVTHFPRL